MSNFEIHGMQAQLASALATLTGLMGMLEIINAALSAIGAILFIGVTVLSLRKMIRDERANKGTSEKNRG